MAFFLGGPLSLVHGGSGFGFQRGGEVELHAGREVLTCCFALRRRSHLGRSFAFGVCPLSRFPLVREAG